MSAATVEARAAEAPPRPVTPPPVLDALPEELKRLAQWILWKWELNDKGRWTKVPYRATGTKASSTKRASWTTYERAVAAYLKGGYDGIGFVFSADDELCGADLDKCRNPVTGTIDPKAAAWIGRFATYAEASPSGTGVHLIACGRVPEGRKTDEGEIYCQGRFFTMSGHTLPGTPTTIEPAHDAIEAFWTYLTGLQGTRPNGNGATVDVDWDEFADVEEIREKLDELLRVDLGFRRAWNHDTSGLFNGMKDTSLNAWDLSLCTRAAFAGWSDTELALLIRVHREKHGSAKWQRADYVERTVRKAREAQEQRQERETEPDAAEADDAELDKKCAWLRCEDVGNAERFVARFGRDVRWCSTMGWFVWDGARWLRDEKAIVVDLAKRTARAIYREAKTVERQADAANREADEALKATAEAGDAAADEDHRQAKAKVDKAKKLEDRANALKGWARASCANGRITAMLELVRPAVAVVPDELDADPWALNVKNGTIDLRTGEFRPHRREDLLTKLAGVAYEPNAPCERFLKFLKEIFKSEEDLIRFVHRGVGYSITGRIDEHVMMICHGAGANGKTTLMEILAEALGDYAQQTPSETFLAKDRTGNIPNDLARLKGARFVSASETEQGRYLAESLVKQATGGDRMTARFLRREFFEFRPQLKLWLSTNHKPEIRGTDDGIWRRIRLVPFRVQFVDEADLASRPDAQKKDPKLPDTLREELPGILAWAVRGAVEWRKNGLGEAEAVREATRDYRAEQDRLGEFIADLCDVAPTYSKKASELYRAYCDWCEANGVDGFERMTQTAFGRAMSEKGFRKEKAGLIVYRGIDLKDGWEGILKKATGEGAAAGEPEF